MLSEKIRTDLDGLVKIGQGQNYKINSILFYNIYAALSESEKEEDTILEMEEYLNQFDIEVVADGVELEEIEGGAGIDSRIRPFNPSKIKINMQSITMDALFKRIKNQEINLNTEFQRKSGLWSNEKKSQLIESLLLKIPLPAFYFDASMDDNWLVIDGLQRITAVKEFVVDKTLALTGMEFFTDLNGLFYDDLPRPFVRRIEETNIIVYKVEEGTPQNVKYNIFKRINTGGLELEAQEIRHALYQGKASKLVKELAEQEAFLKVTCSSIRKDRMLDREFVLRFIAVTFYGIENYKGVMDEFLNEAMEYINSQAEDKIIKIKEKFTRTMERTYSIFQIYAFRKMAADGRRRPINKAIYEIWCKILFDLTEEEYEILESRAETVKKEFIRLCDTWEFQTFVKSSDKTSYNKRMEKVQELVEGVLDAEKD